MLKSAVVTKPSFLLFVSSSQLVTVATGVPTAATSVSVRMERSATRSPEPASACLGTEGGAARPSVKREPMGTGASRNASARMELPVTMSLENASARQDTLELCESVGECVRSRFLFLLQTARSQVNTHYVDLIETCLMLSFLCFFLDSKASFSSGLF